MCEANEGKEFDGKIELVINLLYLFISKQNKELITWK
jgi:hypothetical protein